jgi:KDO2-lipid IV(A) lauroyltransferase
MTLKERLTYVGFRTAWTVCAWLPESIVKGFFKIIADVTFARNGIGAKRLRFNIARVLGKDPIDPAVVSVARAAMESYFRYWADLFRLQTFTIDEIRARARFENQHVLDDSLAKGKGVVVVLTHSGNWDFCGAFVASTYRNITSVAERLKPEKLFDAFVEVRTRYGITVLPHKGGSRPPFEILKERLSDGQIVALASDRDFTRRGIPAKFFGVETLFPGGAVRLAQETGAALIYAALWNDGKVAVLTLSGPIEVQGRSDVDIMQDVANEFEKGISRNPENWHMLQQIWPDHPERWGGKRR